MLAFITIASAFAFVIWAAKKLKDAERADRQITGNFPKPQTLNDAISVSAPSPPPLPQKRYFAKKSILSNAERDFHLILLKAVPEAPIFPKVRVADVMEAAERYSGDFLRISQKHFDWILCHPVSFEPLLIIELDDSSHHWSAAQKKNDATKNLAASEAKIPLLRFKWAKIYNEEAVRTQIATAINNIADEKNAKNNRS